MQLLPLTWQKVRNFRVNLITELLRNGESIFFYFGFMEFGSNFGPCYTDQVCYCLQSELREG